MKKTAHKLPSFQFYPGDWMKDPALSICSAGARGVWMDIICLMFESEHRGYLVTNGRPWTLEQIAIAVRGDWQENLTYVKELVHHGVMKQVLPARKDRKCPPFLGAFFSSRMVSDQCQRDVWRAQKRRQRVENKQKMSYPVSTRSSSSSSSSPSKTSSHFNFSQDTESAAATNGGQKNGWVNRDQERKNGTAETLHRVFPDPETLAGDVRGDVPKKQFAKRNSG